jgi:tetratricopeptide (TPR) repeat protein
MRFRLVPAAVAALVLASSALAGDLEDGLALKKAGKFEEALPKLQKAAEADPAGADAAAALSEVLAGLGKYEQASRALAKALEAHPDDVRLLVARGRALLLSAEKAGREGADSNMILATVADADRWVVRALAKDPKHSEARVLKAKVLQHQGGSDAPEAIAALEAVAADDPKCFDAHWELGQIWMRKARADWKDKTKWAAAEKHFRDATTADPASGQALLQATFCRHWQSATPDLIADYEKCAAMLPGDPSPLAQVWKFKKGSLPQVRAAFERLAAKPGQEKAKAYVLALDAEGAVAAGKPADAAKAAIGAVEAWGKDPARELYDAMNGLAFGGAGLAKEDRDRIWTAMWKQWPDRFEAPNNAGFWYRDVGHDFRKSAEWYERAAAIATTSPAVLNDTGLIYHYHLNDFEKAEKWYSAAVQAAEEQGTDVSQAGGRDLEATGYRDAMNNMARLLTQQKKWKELRKFAEDHVPEGFPGRDQWLSAGDK